MAGLHRLGDVLPFVGRVGSRPSDTAEANALMRAAESLVGEPRRLLDDPFAAEFVRRPVYRAMLVCRPLARLILRVFDWRYPGLHGHVVLRARYTDAELVLSVRSGIDQVVLLGAGFDSTANRHPEPTITVYEVDAVSTQDAKRNRGADASAVRPGRVVYVPADFRTAEWATALVAAGFDRQRPAVFVWMGVTCYLDAGDVEQTVRLLATISARHSRLVLDHLPPAVVDGTTDHLGARRVAAMVARRGEAYRCGYTKDGLARLLSAEGYVLRDHAGLDELARRFGASAAVWCSTDGWHFVATAVRA